MFLDVSESRPSACRPVQGSDKASFLTKQGLGRLSLGASRPCRRVSLDELWLWLEGVKYEVEDYASCRWPPNEVERCHVASRASTPPFSATRTLP